MSSNGKTALLKRFHALCAMNGLGADEKQLIVRSYGHTSSKELSERELEEILHTMQGKRSTAPSEADTWRKRVMAAIGAWLRTSGREESAHEIKAIACRATGHRDFNDIPISRLRNVYYEFRNKQADAQTVRLIKAEEIDHLAQLN